MQPILEKPWEKLGKTFENVTKRSFSIRNVNLATLQIPKLPRFHHHCQCVIVWVWCALLQPSSVVQTSDQFGPILSNFVFSWIWSSRINLQVIVLFLFDLVKNLGDYLYSITVSKTVSIRRSMKIHLNCRRRYMRSNTPCLVCTCSAILQTLVLALGLRSSLKFEVRTRRAC